MTTNNQKKTGLKRQVSTYHRRSSTQIRLASLACATLRQMGPFQRKMPGASQIFRSRQKITIVFIFLSAAKRAKLHLSETIISTISLFGYVIYSSGDARCQQRASPEE